MKPLFILATVFAVLFVSTALAVATGETWPSLRFSFTIRRSAMQVHGYSDFSVVANPIVSEHDTGSRVLYDTFATFTEDSTLYDYTLVDGRSYVSQVSLDDSSSNPSVECEEDTALLSINSIVGALVEAVPVSSITSKRGGAIECSGGDTFKVSVDGIDFGVCFTGRTGFTMYGNDMDIEVEYVKTQETIPAPKGVPANCDSVASPSSVTSIGRSLLTGESMSPQDARRLKSASLTFDFVLGNDDDSCSCKSTPRPCIFVHGLGISKEEPENLDVFPTNYWGNLTDHAPCCSSIKYAMLNTVNNSWTDDEQQQKVCDRVLAVSKTSQGTMVSDTIIITHSMGGLLVAGAIATGKCSLDKSVSWVGLSAPMRGSMASNYFQDSCMNETNFIVEDLAAKTGFCPADDGIISLAYQGDDYSTPELDAAYAAAQKVYRREVTALMCSNGFSGLRSKRQWWYWTLGTVVPHKSFKNDGMVEFHSCAGGFPPAHFGNSYKNAFYVTKLNHADTAFRNGDSLLNKAKMPLKWFQCLL
ncbi:hypothetical protein PHYSODRAFT_335843 [Phytophthora sojae]|uniref:GPI inositol-deacylase n=1 Tax=Phytophthora sojae (strain P6497) TaxID=1094619 RepID=G4ZRZ4_PHYSP|nr:hypothetical protein PHYSODRAFT_335843 [Phytophthora sojae]EGZ14173.1 hypothetical protein PHYSODRAFT_335843 [Phytophthora sojae]|eukprot:XP_009531602.1 hypothetical protein PHYSODRAFT_335843 [Phytophthora sojae]